MQVSYDDYHAPFATFEKVVHAVRAGADAGIKLEVVCVADERAQWTTARIRSHLAAALGVDAQTLESIVGVFGDYPTPSGTGEPLVPLRTKPLESLEIGCRDVGKSLSIHPNGLVKCCCGHAMFYSQDLTIGNLFHESLATILERASHNLLLWWIHMYGPK